jgi:hypothetical protein
MERNTRQRLLELVIARLGWTVGAQRLHVEKLAPLVDLIDETNGR